VRTRTELTTPPGQEPDLGGAATSDDEVYVHGLALPEEPTVPGRFRRLWATLLVVVVLATAGYVTVRATTAGGGLDPALDPEFAPAGETDG
jgi:hypothetical protein